MACDRLMCEGGGSSMIFRGARDTEYAYWVSGMFSGELEPDWAVDKLQDDILHASTCGVVEFDLQLGSSMAAVHFKRCKCESRTCHLFV